jgi:transglutaminase-like putative cysteine protease
MLLSAILAHTRLHGAWAAVILGVVGLIYVGDAVAHFLPPLSGAATELWEGITWLWLRLREFDVEPPTFELWGESGARLFTFGERLSVWGATLTTGRSEQNPLVFLFVSGSILWASTAWALWGLIRWGRPLLALLPLGLVLSMSTYLSTGHEGYLFGFVACATLLFPVVYLNREEQRWNREGVDYSPEIRLDVWQIASIIMVIVILLSFLTPSVSIPRLIHSFWKLISRPQEVFEDFMVRFFGGVEPAPPTPMPVGGGSGGRGGGIDASLPRAHLLGGGTGLSNQLVMYVTIDAPPPMPEETYYFEEELIGPKYYWRGITYDTFSGRHWSNGPSSRREIPAYEPVLASVVTNTSSLKQRYLIQVPHGDSLYAVGEPYVVDQAVESRRRTEDDLIAIEGATNDYIVTSHVSQATARDLESSSIAYPPHILDRYLGLPDRLPDRVRRLASEIVQDASSTYEMVMAIEHYLRRFPYDLEVPSPPPGQNVVDYFLFDAQRGYCDYYASSFVVLARLAGLPSRLAVGYAMGGYDPDCGCYVVVERDAHSWPEVYFTGHGWIPFEPTAPFRQFERPRDFGSRPDWTPTLPAIPRRPWDVALREWWRRVSQYWTTYATIAVAAALLVFLIVREYRQWRFNRLSPVTRIATYYEEMSSLGERLGAPRRPQDTPAEYGTILAAAVHARVARWPWRERRLDPVTRQAGAQVGALSRAYERASYSPHPLPKPYQIQVERQWEQLQSSLRWMRYASREGEQGLTGA